MQGRADAAQQTAVRIQEAATALFRSRPFPDVTLQAVADAAGVTLQTVLRRFGSKEALFKAAAAREADAIVSSRRVDRLDDPDAAVRTLVASYERMGDLGWQGLAQEDRFPLVRTLLDDARQRHRTWIEATFPAALADARGPERRRRVLLLVAATDFYLWKLYRRDLGLSRRATTARLTDLVAAVLRDCGSPR